MQAWHETWMVMIRVMQLQHGGPFINPNISILDISTTDTDTRASFGFHNMNSILIVEQFLEGLIKLLQHQDALLINNVQEGSCANTWPNHASS